MDDSQYNVGGPVSMPLRMEAKRKKTRLGIIAICVGVPALGAGVFGFARGGAEMLGVWGVGLGVIMIAVGIVMLKKANKPYY